MADDDDERRRVFLTRAGMAGGLLAGYGTFAGILGGYLYRSEPPERTLVFVAALRDFPTGSSRSFVGPRGDRVTIARQAESGDVSDFVALSSTCPHLGCQVHWQPDQRRFFCPCHNGAFGPDGVAIEGPPKSEGQKLAPYALTIDDGLLFIEVAV